MNENEDKRYDMVSSMIHISLTLQAFKRDIKDGVLDKSYVLKMIGDFFDN